MGTLQQKQGKQIKRPRGKSGRDVMDMHFALFNYHSNNAHTRAKVSFIKLYGRKAWDAEIEPHEKSGIMSLMENKPNEWTMAYVTMVHVYVNENRELSEEDAQNMDQHYERTKTGER